MKIEISYSQCGDHLIPNLVLPEEDQQSFGKYGRMRKRCLKDHRPVLYSDLLLSGKLNLNLAEIEEACEERMELLTQQMASQEALTDTLTAKQKEIFEDYMTAQREVNVLTDCETFLYSFRLAAKIMVDVLTNGQMREI